MKLKGVYTVEASFVVSITLILIGAAISLGYQVFSDAAKYVVREESEFDAVEAFRLKDFFE